MLIVPAVLGIANLLVSFPDIRIWFRNARQIPPWRATACNTQEKTAGGRWGILNQKSAPHIIRWESQRDTQLAH